MIKIICIQQDLTRYLQNIYNKGSKILFVNDA